MFFVGVLLGYFMVYPLILRFLSTYQLSATIENQISLNSVSYTHLDVYKRQTLKRINGRIAGAHEQIFRSACLLLTFGTSWAVSYTHLDVYKRQV